MTIPTDEKTTMLAVADRMLRAAIRKEAEAIALPS